MSVRDEIISALTEVSKMHSKEFAHVNGVDPEWPEWYADRLLLLFRNIEMRKMDLTELASNLKILDQKYRAEEPDISWQEYYADHFLNM